MSPDAPLGVQQGVLLDAPLDVSLDALLDALLDAPLGVLLEDQQEERMLKDHLDVQLEDLIEEEI